MPPLDVRSSLRAVTDWYRHALEFRAAGGASFFAEHPSADDRAYALEASGRLDIAARTNLEALLSHQHDKDIRSAPNLPSRRRSAVISGSKAPPSPSIPPSTGSPFNCALPSRVHFRPGAEPGRRHHQQRCT